MRAVGFLPRFLGIVLAGALALTVYGLARLFVRDEDVPRLRGRVLRITLSRLGATFIKLGQVMSTRPDLFEPELIEELRALQDRLPAFDGARARAQVEAALGAKVDTLFASFDDTPVAAASVAQVHRAVLRDGTEVAVKVLRPDVRRKTERDATILLALARVAMRLHPSAAHANLEGHLSHFVDGVRAQTDLRTEARNYTVIRANFEGFPGVLFPRVHPELSAEQVMTMDFVRGRKIDTLEPSKRPVVAPRLRNAFLKMLFEDGFVHADLHPGNMLVLDDGTVAIFDVGLCKELDEELLVQYIDFNRCLAMGSSADFVRHLRTYHSYVAGSIDWDALQRDVDALHAEFLGRPAAEIEFGALIDRVFALARRHGIRPVPDMTLLIVGLVTAEGLGKQLDPTSDSFGEVARFLMPILARRGMLAAA